MLSMVVLGLLLAGVAIGVVATPFTERMIRRSARLTSWWRHLAHRPLLVVAEVTLVAFLVATCTGVGLVMGANFSNQTDRLGGVGAVIGGGAFLLAVLAGLIAVLAYADATRQPHLKVLEAYFEKDGQKLGTSLPVDGSRVGIQPHTPPPNLSTAPTPVGPVTLKVRFENDGEAVARDFSLIVQLEGVFFDPLPPELSDRGWSHYQIHERKWAQIQWEGVGRSAIYPDQVYTATVELSSMWAVPGTPSTDWGKVRLFADRSPPCEQRFPIQIL